MEDLKKGRFAASFMMAAVVYVICWFFNEKMIGLLVGGLAFVAVYIALGLFHQSYTKKADAALAEVEDEVLHHCMATCYTPTIGGSGWLMLTKEQFIFLRVTVKETSRMEIPYFDVKGVDYGAIHGEVKGMTLWKCDGTHISFSIPLEKYKQMKTTFETLRPGKDEPLDS